MRNSRRTGSHRIRGRIKVTHRIIGNTKGKPKNIPRTVSTKIKLRIMHRTDSTKTRLRTICIIIHRITSTKIRGREIPMPLRFPVRSFLERKRPHGGFFSVRKKVNL